MCVSSPSGNLRLSCCLFLISGMGSGLPGSQCLSPPPTRPRLDTWGHSGTRFPRATMISLQEGGLLEGGSRGRGHVYLWLIHVEVWQKTTKFCRAITLQLKKLKRGLLGCFHPLPFQRVSTSISPAWPSRDPQQTGRGQLSSDVHLALRFRFLTLQMCHTLLSECICFNA